MSMFRSETPARRSKTTRAVVACEGLEGRQLLTGGGGYGLPPFARMGMGMGMGMDRGGPGPGAGGSPRAAQVGGTNAAGAAAMPRDPGGLGMFGSGQGRPDLAAGGGPGQGWSGWQGGAGTPAGGAAGGTSAASAAATPPALPDAVQKALQTLRDDSAAITGAHKPTHVSVGLLMDDQDAVAAGTLTGADADAKLKADKAAILASAGLTADQVAKIQADEQAVDDAFKAAGIDPKSFGPGRDHTPPAGQAPAATTTTPTTPADTTTAAASTAAAATTTPATDTATATAAATAAPSSRHMFMNRHMNGVGSVVFGANHARGGSAGQFAHARRGPGALARGARGLA